jgi:2-iminobutanoate/2-iminopropanoate deaminase
MRKFFLVVAALGFVAAPVAAQTPGAGAAPAQQTDSHLRFIGTSGALSTAVVAGNTVYLSGVLGNRGGPTVEEQTHVVMQTIRDNLAQVGGTMDDVVKCLVMMADLSERPKLNPIYASYFPNTKPARSAIGVDGGPSAAGAQKKRGRLAKCEAPFFVCPLH